MKEYTRVCARIDLDAIEYNMDQMHETVGDATKIMAVVKMDGYGHGAVPIACDLEKKNYLWGFATATPDEGVILRANGIRKPILVLGPVFPSQQAEAIEHEIRFTCYTKEIAEQISKTAVKLGKTAYVHIKLDTGMSRLGFQIDEENADTIAEIAKLPGIEMEGMYTHFSKADEADKAYAHKQLEHYLWMRKALEDRNVTFKHYHCANSAAILDLPETYMDIVRSGISTYGLYPSDEVDQQHVHLKPAMELISHVSHVKWVEAGVPVSYGGTFVTERPTKIVTVPVGYGDGYPRSLSNKGFVLIHGKKAPILGRICMDQFMVDCTEIENVAYGDRVVLIGRDGDNYLPVETLSDLSGRFSYEFVCDLGKRIPREFLKDGKVIEQIDYFA